MKNPFTAKLVATEAKPGQWWLVYEGEETSAVGNTEEQCRYAAHAINQHEKLMAMLKERP